MAVEIDIEELHAAVTAKIAELKDIWTTDPKAPLNETEVRGAVEQFKDLVPKKYLDAGMALELAMSSAALTATAIANHPRRMIEAAEELGLHSWDHNVEITLFHTGQQFRVDACRMTMCFIAITMGIKRELTPEDFAAITKGHPLSYEEFPIQAFKYFSAEIEREIAAKTPLLN